MDYTEKPGKGRFLMVHRIAAAKLPWSAEAQLQPSFAAIVRLHSKSASHPTLKKKSM
jgi:hypothetical protein